jgi:DNA-binding CsgD family transcriptional regulator/tetratricopeptide (TPR) repeat protein
VGKQLLSLVATAAARILGSAEQVGDGRTGRGLELVVRRTTTTRPALRVVGAASRTAPLQWSVTVRPSRQPEEVGRTSVDATVLEAARHAYARRAWGDAREAFEAAGALDQLEVDDLERLATASYLSGHDRSSADAWAAAHRLRLDADDADGAVLCAFWLAFGLITHGEMAEGGGWLARAQHLVEERALDGPCTGYLRVPHALGCLERGDHDEAFAEFDAAGVIARRFDDRDLAAFSMLGRGQALCCLGRTDEGVAHFDEVMVAVTSGEVSPVVAGIVYCAVIDECQQAFDVSRAFEWTGALSRWCDEQPGLVPFRGQCLVHRAQILQLRGAWNEAYDEARLARERLAEPPHPAIGMAHYQLGELQRLRGDLDQAAQSYRRAQETGRSPHPGLALILLARNDVDAAAAAIDTAVAGSTDAIARTRLLPAYVEIMISAGRVDDARRAAGELVDLADASPTAYLRAVAAHTSGAVAVRDGRAREGLAMLRAALAAWSELEVPYEAARCRALLATACTKLGDSTTAGLELAAARRTFVQLGAHLDLRTTDWSGSADSDRDQHGRPPLTDRELQMLRRVAQGATNAEIAEDLFVSVKTVERHLSNVLRKLDVPNRAAATAVALEQGLLLPPT